jgi:hypothetical protein
MVASPVLFMRQMGPRTARIVLVAALAAIAGFLLRGTLAGRTLFVRDVNMVWLPQVESFVQCVAAGSWPLWDPYSAFGRSLVADPRAEIFYPPTWLNLVVSPATYYTLFAVTHLLVAAGGAWRLARSWDWSPGAAFVSAAVWMTSGPLLSLVSMWHHLAGAAWMPWAVLAFERLAAAPSRRRVAAAAVTTAVQMLAGSPDFAVLTGLVVLLDLMLAPGVWSGPRRARRAGAVLAAVSLAAALSAPQWWPTLEVVRRSSRKVQDVRSAGTWSLHPWVAAETVVPFRWAELPTTPEALRELLEEREPWLRSIYLGAVTAVLVGAGLGARSSRRGALGGIALVCFLLSLGNHSPAWGALGRVPGVSSLRFPVKAMVPFALAWALLAGLGFEAWRAGDARARRGARWTGTLVTVLLTGAVLLFAGRLAPSWWTSRLGSPAPALIMGPVVIALLLAGGATALLGRATAWTSAVLAALIVGDLAVRHGALTPTADRGLFRHRPATLRLLDTTAFARTYVYDYPMDPGRRRPVPIPRPYQVARLPEGWSIPEALVLGVHEYLNPPTAARWRVFGSFDMDILDFDPIFLKEMDRGLREAEESPGHLRLLRLGAVRNVVALVPASWWKDLTPVGSVPGYFTDPIRVFRVPDPLPRAFVASGARIADGEKALATLVDPSFDPRREIVLAEGTPRAPASGPPGAVTITRLACDRVSLAVEAEAEGHAVLVDAYDPGWTATVDGRPADVRRANVAFRAVAVPAGRHVVEMAYRPRGLRYGLALALGGGAALAALVLRGRERPNSS